MPGSIRAASADGSLLGKRLDHRYRYGGVFSPEARLIQADPSPAEIGRNRGVAVGIQGDLGAVVEQLTAACAARAGQHLDGWTAQLRQDRDAWEEELRSKADAQQPMHPLDVYTGLEQHLDADTTLIMDGGDYVQWGRAFLKARRPGRFMRLGPLSHLGAGIPYGMAAKLAYPDSKVLVFIGDGAFGFYAMEYDTCIRHNLPITTVLGNDSTWGIDKTFQVAYYGRAVGTDLRTIRYDQMVDAIGGYTEFVESPAEVGGAVGRALASGRPSLVNVTVRSGASPLAEAMIARRTGGRRAGRSPPADIQRCAGGQIIRLGPLKTPPSAIYNGPSSLAVQREVLWTRFREPFSLWDIPMSRWMISYPT